VYEGLRVRLGDGIADGQRDIDRFGDVKRPITSQLRPERRGGQVLANEEGMPFEGHAGVEDTRDVRARQRQRPSGAGEKGLVPIQAGGLGERKDDDADACPGREIGRVEMHGRGRRASDPFLGFTPDGLEPVTTGQAIALAEGECWAEDHG
jgi:hypothetical protein